MCGITGLLDFSKEHEINKKLLVEMSSYLKYRGPDNEGYFIKENDEYCLGFSHRRLSIIDLSEKGNQPMISQSGNSVITFNGEIYNFKELKTSLKNKGRSFKTHSDTELILVAYETWGINKCLDEIEGMFAFSIYDFKKQKLFIARDRFGEKPVYFYKQKNFIAFSSDMRSFNHLSINKTINNYALGYYFSEMCTPQKESIWNEIKKLPPAHYISFTKDQCSIEEYWKINYKNKINISLNESIEQSESLIENAVKKRLVSDVPVGCFLSGGLDSSLISYYAAKNYSSNLKTFSVGFNYEKFNELPFSRTVANKIESDHHEITLKTNNLSSINNLLEEYGEPFADSSQIPTYFISKFAAKKTKVILGGDGGDELFAGYRTYNQASRMQMWNNFKILKSLFSNLYSVSKVRKFEYLYKIMDNDPFIIGSALYRNIGFSQNQLSKLTSSYKQLYSLEKENESLIFDAFKNSNTIFDSILHASIKSRLVNDYLVKNDRASMFNSLELRTPFLDRKLIEFTSSLPRKYIFYNNTNKFIIKKIAEKYFSKKFIYRKKQGFDVPIGEYFKNEWKNEVKDTINCKNPYVDLNYNYINEIFEDHISNKMDNSKIIWILYVFNKWSNQN